MQVQCQGIFIILRKMLSNEDVYLQYVIFHFKLKLRRVMFLLHAMHANAFIM